MIHSSKRRPALEAIQALIVHARLLACESGDLKLAGLLDDLEILPHYIAESTDRTDAFREMLDGIVEKRPELQYILERFDAREAYPDEAPVQSAS